MRQTHVREGCVHVVRLNVKLGPKQLYQPLYPYLRDNAVKKISSLQCCRVLSPSVIPAYLQPVSLASRSMKCLLNLNGTFARGTMASWTYSHTGSVNLNEGLMGMAAYFWMVIDICYVRSPHSGTFGFEIGFVEMTHVLQCQVKGTHW